MNCTADWFRLNLLLYRMRRYVGLIYSFLKLNLNVPQIKITKTGAFVQNSIFGFGKSKKLAILYFICLLSVCLFNWVCFLSTIIWWIKMNEPTIITIRVKFDQNLVYCIHLHWIPVQRHYEWWHDEMTRL